MHKDLTVYSDFIAGFLDSFSSSCLFFLILFFIILFFHCIFFYCDMDPCGLMQIN